MGIMRTATAIFCMAFFLLPNFVFGSAHQECSEFTAEEGEKIEKTSDGQTQTITVDLEKGQTKLKQTSDATSEEIEVKDGKMKITSKCGDIGTRGTITVCILEADGKPACGIKIPKGTTLAGDTIDALFSDNPKGRLRSIMEAYYSARNKINAIPNSELGKITLPKELSDLLRNEYGISKSEVQDFIKKQDPEDLKKLLIAAAEKKKATTGSIIRKMGLPNADVLAEEMVKLSPDTILGALPKSDQASSGYFCGFSNECTAVASVSESGIDTSNVPILTNTTQKIPVFSGVRVSPRQMDLLPDVRKKLANGVYGIEGLASCYGPNCQSGPDRFQGGWRTRTGDSINFNDPGMASSVLPPGVYGLGCSNSGCEFRAVTDHGPGGPGTSVSVPTSNIFDLYDNGIGYKIGRGSGRDDYTFYVLGTGTGSELKASREAVSIARTLNSIATKDGIEVALRSISSAGGQYAAPNIASVATNIASGKIEFSGAYNTNTTDYWTGVGNRASASWSSPGSSYSGGGGSLGGNVLRTIAGIGSYIVRLVTGQGTQQVTPSAPTPPTRTGGKKPPKPIAPIVTPVVTLTSFPTQVSRGNSIMVIWASSGVSSTQACTLFEEQSNGEKIMREQKNSGKYNTDVSTAYASNMLKFILECVPADARVKKSDATKRLEISVI
jgi:hypothetical protein